MKTKIKILLGASLFLLITLGLTRSAAAQTDRMVFYTKVIATSVSKRGVVSYTTNRQVMTMNVDGSDLRQLTTGTQDSVVPSWRPGKTHILFRREGTLLVMDANGAGTFAVATVIPGTAADWSPDGNRICYVAPRADGHGIALWIVAVDPAARRNKVGPPMLVREGDCFAPVWSPDGTRIAFSDQNTGLLPVGPRIRVLDLATGDVSTHADMQGLLPSWSPDGNHIAYCGGLTSGEMHLWIMNADFSGATQITSLDKPVLWPTWSPDGSQMAFRMGTGQNDAAIYKLTLGTGELTLLREYADHPDWAP
jgi:Tol biopolymer transport system component